MIPKNELGVLVLFSQEAPEKGVEITHVQSDFPDMVLEVNGEWYRAEVEFKASNFISHGHDVAGCDLIICWQNDLDDGFTFPIVALSAPWSASEIRKPTRAELQVMYWRGRAVAAEKELHELKTNISTGSNVSFGGTSSAGAPPRLFVIGNINQETRRAHLPQLIKAGIPRKVIAEAFKVHEATISKDLQAIEALNGRSTNQLKSLDQSDTPAQAHLVPPEERNTDAQPTE